MKDLVTWLTDIDVAVLLRINSGAASNGVIDRLVYDIASSDMLKGGVFMAVYWWLWFDRKGAMRHEMVVGVVAGIATAILSRFLQVTLPFHQRPLHTPDIGVKRPLSVDPETLNTFSSFPSDHAMLFFALSVPLWRRALWLGAAAMAWTALVICLPRIYLGYHYPSDVLAGAILGIPCMLLLSVLVVRTGLPERAVTLACRKPAIFYPIAFILCFELAMLFADARRLLVDAYRLAEMTIA